MFRRSITLNTRFKLFCGLLIFLLAHKTANSSYEQMDFSKKLAIFGINMYGKLLLLKPNDNIVFSPFSIQTCAAMARVGAEGSTADELEHGLGLSSDFGEMTDTFYDTLSSYEESNVLKIANKIYVMKGLSISPNFNNVLSKKFLTSAEEIDFSKNTDASKTINVWIESKTNNLIKDLIPASSINANTRLLLLNAIYFKGNWLHKFAKRQTQIDNFYLNEEDTVKVPMMSQRERFRYGKFEELDATALEMPYKNSDLSMLILLPNSRTGLSKLEDALQQMPMSDITKELQLTEVIVKIPKFKVEFSVELNEPFKQLGMGRMFTSKAEFGKMLSSGEQLQVSKILHKAFIEVNEEGTEAAAATGIVIRKKRGINFSDPASFIAEHPFIYVIYRMPTTNVVDETFSPIPLFMGAIKNLDSTPEIVEHNEL